MPQCRKDFSAAIVALAKIVHGIKDALYEPNLVGFWIEGPSASQNDDLDLAGRMPQVVIGLQAYIGLQIRVEGVFFRPLSARLIRKITLGHTHIIGTKYAGARARKGFGQHGNGCDTGHGAHRLAPQFMQHALVVCRDALLSGKSAPGVD